MHSNRRSSLRGTVIYTLITILILIAMMQFVFLNMQHKEENKALQLIIAEQIETIDDLSSKNAELNEEIISLEKEIKNMSIKQNIGGAFKSYTDYKCLSRSSKQWDLQTKAYTDEYGLRKIGDAYLVALGSYYGTTLGTKYKVTMVSGATFNIILCDCKRDEHTDNKNQTTVSDGSILEFYVDTSMLHNGAKITGDISAIDFFAGDIASIEKY